MLRFAYRAADPPADPEALSPSGPLRGFKQFGLALLCAAWVVLGIVGHDPWKSDDATTFGVAWDIMRGANALVPTLAGEPYVARPPLVPALAALAGAVLSPPLAPHDAARVVVGVLLAATLWLVSLAAVELSGRAWRWLPPLLFVGSLGLWDRGHQLSPELGLVLGIALATYGFALGLRRPVAGGVALGLGIAISFLSRGLMGPLWLAATAIVMPWFDTWRTRRYAATIAVALVIAAPLALAWPAWLASHAPDRLAAWWASDGLAGYFAAMRPDGADPLYVLKNLPWIAWPALPLALWTLWMRGRGFNGGLSQPGVELAATLAAVIVIAVSIMPDARATYLLPVLVPLVLLGAMEIDTLTRGFSAALDWFGILTFGLLALVVWALWFEAHLYGMTLGVARLFRDIEVGYQPPFQPLAFAVSLFLTLLWIALVRPARRSNRRAVLNWTAGMVLVWGLFTTIWLPYLDSRRSYRSVAEALAVALPREGCIASRNLGDAQRALFAYFATLYTIREEIDPRHDCRYLLVQYGRLEELVPTERGWEAIWDGHRRGDDTERYVLYRKLAAKPTRERRLSAVESR
jgi:4-amino-4-deoxy-L-arabinose transferase-like glycosyltransferase